MATYTRLPGSEGRYRVNETGEEISRREHDKRTNPEGLIQRERRYSERKRERRERTSYIEPGRMNDNKRYWIRRWAEQEENRRGTSVEIEQARALLPGSKFNRLWAEAERNGFDGGQGSKWDELTKLAGARGGAENEHERSRYLAVIAWHQRNERVGEQKWLEKDADGRFINTPPRVRDIAS